MSNEAIAFYEQPTRYPERSDPAFFLRDAFHRGRGTQSNGSLFDLFFIAKHQSRRQSPFSSLRILTLQVSFEIHSTPRKRLHAQGQSKNRQ
jgi:hypothetical protein